MRSDNFNIFLLDKFCFIVSFLVSTLKQSIGPQRVGGDWPTELTDPQTSSLKPEQGLGTSESPVCGLCDQRVLWEPTCLSCGRVFLPRGIETQVWQPGAVRMMRWILREAIWLCLCSSKGFPDGPVVKSLPMNAGDIRDVSSVPGWGRSPGGGHGNPLQYSCLESPMDRGAWWATLHRVAESRTQLKWLNTHAHTEAQNQKWLSPQTRWIPDHWGSWVTSNGRTHWWWGNGSSFWPASTTKGRKYEEWSTWIPIRILTASLIPINSQKIWAPGSNITYFLIPSSV